MNEVSQLTEFGKVFIFLITGVLLVGFSFFLSRLLSIKRPTPEKLISYECGEEPTGNSWIQFNSRFYVIALIFLLFDVEMAFIFPWTTIFAQKQLLLADARWGWFSLIEMFVFVGILILGLVYVWIKGDLEWIRPKQALPSVSNAIPLSIYQSINAANYQVKAFNSKPNEIEQPEVPKAASASAKPMFKPTFRKPGV